MSGFPLVQCEKNCSFDNYATSVGRTPVLYNSGFFLTLSELVENCVREPLEFWNTLFKLPSPQKERKIIVFTKAICEGRSLQYYVTLSKLCYFVKSFPLFLPAIYSFYLLQNRVPFVKIPVIIRSDWRRQLPDIKPKKIE